jgi:hypothetical protein
MKRRPTASACAAGIPIVVMSTHSGSVIPSSAAATCSPSTSIVISTSAPSAASAGVGASRPPCSATHASAVARVRFQTATS